jgi:DNA repair ATPase RecN
MTNEQLQEIERQKSECSYGVGALTAWVQQLIDSHLIANAELLACRERIGEMERLQKIAQHNVDSAVYALSALTKDGERLTADTAALTAWKEKAREAMGLFVEFYESGTPINSAELHDIKDLIGGREP